MKLCLTSFSLFQAAKSLKLQILVYSQRYLNAKKQDNKQEDADKHTTKPSGSL